MQSMLGIPSHPPERQKTARLRVVPHFFLRDSRASETRARVKITPPKKGETQWGERNPLLSLRKNGGQFVL